MKVGDKVYVELEVIDIKKQYFKTNKGWHNNDDAIPQLPIQEGRWMMVRNFEDIDFKKRYVIGKFEDNFMALEYGSRTSVYYWKYAKEIPVKRKLTIQEIAEKFGEDVENIEICQK